MKNETIKKLLIANLIVTVLLIVLVVLLLKWTIPSTTYEGYSFRVKGKDLGGTVVSVTDLPGNKIRIIFTNDSQSFACEVDEDLVTFQKPLQPSY